MKNGKADADRIGDVLLAMGAITPEHLAEAAAKQRGGDSRPLGVLLVELGHATANDVEIAVMRQSARRGQLTHVEGLRLLDEAQQSTRRAAGCLDELTRAAEELSSKER
jgi:hypothetical protein